MTEELGLSAAGGRNSVDKDGVLHLRDLFGVRLRLLALIQIHLVSDVVFFVGRTKNFSCLAPEFKHFSFSFFVPLFFVGV